MEKFFERKGVNVTLLQTSFRKSFLIISQLRCFLHKPLWICCLFTREALFTTFVKSTCFALRLWKDVSLPKNACSTLYFVTHICSMFVNHVSLLFQLDVCHKLYIHQTICTTFVKLFALDTHSALYLWQKHLPRSRNMCTVFFRCLLMSTTSELMAARSGSSVTCTTASPSGVG